MISQHFLDRREVLRPATKRHQLETLDICITSDGTIEMMKRGFLPTHEEVKKHLKEDT